MSTHVKLPRRLPDREPVRSEPPNEADWLRRAIRFCERWGCECAAHGSVKAWICRHGRPPDGPHSTIWARWLPEHLRRVPLAELRQRLAALEAEEPTP